MSGMIICGYPGIGKSSIAGWNNCIDFDSSTFTENNKRQVKSDGKWIWETRPDWYRPYCMAAMKLARQGYTVMISTHSDVISYFKFLKDTGWNTVPVVICYPQTSLQEAWAEKVFNRYREDPLPKNKRAYERVRDHFDDILKLEESGLPTAPITTMEYDFKEMVELMQKAYCFDIGGVKT